jgi:hypothetical protein
MAFRLPKGVNANGTVGLSNLNFLSFGPRRLHVEIVEILGSTESFRRLFN